MNFIISDNILDELKNPSIYPGIPINLLDWDSFATKVRSSTVNKLRDDLDKIGFLLPIVTD